MGSLIAYRFCSEVRKPLLEAAVHGMIVNLFEGQSSDLDRGWMERVKTSIASTFCKTCNSVSCSKKRPSIDYSLPSSGELAPEGAWKLYLWKEGQCPDTIFSIASCGLPPVHSDMSVTNYWGSSAFQVCVQTSVLCLNFCSMLCSWASYYPKWFSL